MAEFSEIVERYNAGQTDLKAETAFIYKTQGEAAAYDFARALDEAIGSKPYNEVMTYTAQLKEAASKPQFNEAAAAQSEMYKQKLVRERIEKQAKEKALSDSMTLQKSQDIGNVVSKNKQPLLEGERSGGYGLRKEKDAPQAVVSEKDNTILYILLAAAAVLLLYTLTKK